MQIKNRGEFKRQKNNYLKNNAQSKKVYQYDLNGNLVKIWPSTMECGRNGFDQSAVAKCCRGKLKQCKGYIWKYSDET